MPRPRTISDDVVLASLSSVLLARGPHDFTLAEVGRACGLSAATLIQRFKSKEGLLLAFAKHSAKTTVDVFAASEKPRGLRRIFDALVKLTAGHGERGAMANSLSLLLEDIRTPRLRAAARRQAEALEASIHEELAVAMRQRELRRTDPTRLARVLLTTWNGSLITWALRGNGSLRAWVEAALDEVLAPYRR